MLADFEFFCAICGGPLSTVNCLIADPDDDDSEIRNDPEMREWVVSRRLERRPTDDLEKVLQIRAAFDGSKPYYDEYNSYDPQIVTTQDLAWLEDVCILGLEQGGEEKPWAFFYESAVEEDWGSIRAPVDGKMQWFKSYDNEDYPRPPVFPFHRCCFDVLSKAFGHQLDNRNGLVLHALYDVIDNLGVTRMRYLGTYYDEAEGRQATWRSVIGEEYSVANPSVAGPDVLDAIELQARQFTLVDEANRGVKQRCSPGEDAFANLPNEILCAVAENLGLDDLKALMEASHIVYAASRDNIFWKRYMLTAMPWFWELRELIIHEALPPDTDYRRFCLWADYHIRIKLGMRKPFLGIAHRRGIWDVWAGIAPKYAERLKKKSATYNDESAKEIRDDMFDGTVQAAGLTEWPEGSVEAKSTRPVWSQWVYDWEEVDEQAGFVETYFDYDGFLVGMSVTFGDSRRVLGRDGSSEHGRTRENRPMMERVHIKSRGWIAGLIMHTAKRPMGDMNGIVGITILTTAKAPSFYRIGNTLGVGPERHGQPIFPTGDRHLVGLVGQVAQDERIVGLGLLQCDRFDEDGETVALYEAVEEDYVRHLVDSFQVEPGKCRCGNCEAHGMRFWERVQYVP